MKRFASLLVILAASFSPAWALQRTLTNQDGVSIVAELDELIDKDGVETLSFKRVSDQRSFEIALSTLSFDDQSAIRKWWKEEEKARQLLSPNVDLDINFKQNRKKKSINSSYYSDNNRYSYTPEVRITNDDLYRSFKGNKVRIVCFAEHTYHRGTLKVTSASDSVVDFPRNGDTTVYGNSYEFANYESDYSNYEYGWEHAGYIVVIRNSKDEITHIKTDEDDFQRNVKNALKADEGDYYSKDLRSERSSYRNY
ncbi:hypothetical protein [Cerasicoccus arenae]|uniref:Uncharacterized protein n=1 Tax=Cerasicoccus arenae TaxID=424488 RepID=A0A8J3GC66_9BACT|nr:hypothetical protein [Cerasicoccus arenae]MBK1858869.1 hypothetical protein [Cerasicoccus arenae]GHB96163.1 hypothetical protein GCM10007047_09890 [Cerasicoccus arenae]